MTPDPDGHVPMRRVAFETWSVPQADWTRAWPEPHLRRMKSGRLYSLVTKYWPRIAAGLVVVLGLAEFVVGGLTADSRLELYLVAWAGFTGGFWFIFDKAESALAAEVRERVVRGLLEDRIVAALSSTPGQLAVAFDRVFGRQHFSIKCYLRSTVLSITCLLVVAIAFMAADLIAYTDLAAERWRTMLGLIAASSTVMILTGLAYNAPWDYLSLLETRLLLRWANRTPRRVLTLLGLSLVDLMVSGVLALAAFAIGIELVAVVGLVPNGPLPDSPDPREVWVLGGVAAAMTIGVITSFSTSAWFWLYVLSAIATRPLMRMNSGVGFLLRVTDVERQPFRSIGFVSVLIVSGLFLLGLPFVLL